MSGRTTGIARPTTSRIYTCCCGRPVFFRNSQCLSCGTALGFDTRQRRVLALRPAREEGWWLEAGGTRKRALRYRRCANLASASACNWLLDAHDLEQSGLCLSCRLTRRLPDLSRPENEMRWLQIELAKRQLVSSLLGLRLPIESKDENPAQGLAFDLLQATPWGEPVVTAHVDGVITLDVEEADDATREQRRAALGEPYRTLLGHLRHESGHYYWERLVLDSGWLEPFRQRFGDERGDYAQALSAHHASGPPPDWQMQFVSAYASSHPWEDWAETWAHFLHMVDTLDTARSFGIDGSNAEVHFQRFRTSDLDGPADARGTEFVAMLNEWIELNAVLNELSRSMGLRDFYPFVLSLPAVRKLHLVYRVVSAQWEA